MAINWLASGSLESPSLTGDAWLEPAGARRGPPGANAWPARSFNVVGREVTTFLQVNGATKVNKNRHATAPRYGQIGRAYLAFRMLTSP